MARRVIGPRMAELCHLLRSMGGVAPSGRSLYMQLRYRGGHSSNAYASAVLRRCVRAGLMRRECVGRDRWGDARRYRIHITEQGENV